MDKVEQNKKMEEEKLPMPKGWNSVDKPQFGMSNNILSIIFGGLTLLCCLLCFACSMSNMFKNKYSTGFTEFMKTKTGSRFMLALGAVVVILNGIHFNYEENSGYSVFENEKIEIGGKEEPVHINGVSIGMSIVILAYFLFRNLCLTFGEDSFFCKIANSSLIAIIVAVSAGTLIYFSAIQLEREEDMEYQNLTMPVPEME